MRVVRRVVRALCVLAVARAARAQGDEQPQQQPLTTEQVQTAMQAAEAQKDQSILPAPPLEAPPPPPRHKGLVIEQSLGALGFVGKLGSLTGHPAIWLQTQVGYELFKWLMVFINGELALTDTGISQGPAQDRAFPILGFGTGARITIPFTERVGMYVQGAVGGDVAYVPSGELVNFGYQALESLGFWAGGRLGVEWFQVDQHLAIGLSGGARYMANVAYDLGGDAPIAWDATADLRYTF
jgi:hypothetical protein